MSRLSTFWLQTFLDG